VVTENRPQAEALQRLRAALEQAIDHESDLPHEAVQAVLYSLLLRREQEHLAEDARRRWPTITGRRWQQFTDSEGVL
jgi:hypothetical protein